MGALWELMKAFIMLDKHCNKNMMNKRKGELLSIASDMLYGALLCLLVAFVGFIIFTGWFNA